VLAAKQREAETLLDGLRLMGLEPAVLRDIMQERNLETAKRLLVAWKAEVKRAYRAAVLAHHPDRGGSHEAICLLNEAWVLVERLELQERPRSPPPAARTVISIRFHGFETAAGSADSTTSMNHWPGTGGGGWWVP